jgi:PAS domain S-box-containing protein
MGNQNKPSDQPKNNFVMINEKDSLLIFLEKLNEISKEYISELNHYYDSIIACMPNNVYWLDNNGILMGGNDNLAKMFGLKSRSELVGLTYDKMAKLANWQDGQEKMLRKIDIRVIKSGKAEFNIEEPPHFINGIPQYYISTKVPIFNKNKEVIGVIGISTDITERKIAEEREKIEATQRARKEAISEIKEVSKKHISELNHYYDSIIACMPNNVYWLDKDCILMGGNDNLAKMFGLKSRSELVGLTYEQMAKLANWTDGQAEFFKKTELKVMSTGNPSINLEELPVTIKGKVRYYISTKVPIFNKTGNVIGVVGISTDVTERKIAEEKEKIAISNVAKQTAIAETEVELRQAVMILTGSIAHDLRTPITSLETMAYFLKNKIPILLKAYKQAVDADLLLEETIDDGHLEYLENFHSYFYKTLNDMNNFIDTTLKTLKTGLNKDFKQSDFICCSMWHCLHNTLLRYPFLNNQRNIISWDQKDFTFLGNEILMIRVFSNLIKNSLEQITQSNKGRIIITTEKDNETNTIRFKDTAGGASPAIINNLFDGYKTTKAQGTGVGLAFCRIILESFGGNIMCNSIENEFIEFVITLPNMEEHEKS